MKKLTDVQRVILATAAARKRDQVLPLAATLGLKDDGPGSVVLMGMLARGLLAERPALEDEPIWRLDEDNAKIALIASPVGLAAIGIEPESIAPPEHGARPTAKKLTATSTDSAPRAAKAEKTKAAAQPQRPASRSAARPTRGGTAPTTPRSMLAGAASATKGEKILELLRRKQGATISDLMEVTNWQAHSVRGFLAGTVKKKLGLWLISEKNKTGDRRYRIKAAS